MSTDELLAEALRLTRIERARVAEELLSSLEEPDDDVAAAWATELERRSREIAEGRVQPTSWPTARTEILKELEQRRASRTAHVADAALHHPSRSTRARMRSISAWTSAIRSS